MLKIEENWRIVNIMDNVVYLDYKAKELENLRSGQKTMIIRGAMGRKLPYGRVEKFDINNPFDYNQIKKISNEPGNFISSKILYNTRKP